MNAIQQLDHALQYRNTEINKFLEEIIAIINESVDNLPFCTRANSTPEVEGSVKILRRDLDEIISRIKDDRNINKDAAEALVSRLKFTNVKKAPEDPARLSDISSFRSSEFSGSSPRPSSDLAGLRFSSEGNSSANVSPRTSFASANGSPRTSFASANGSPRISETGSVNGGKRSRSRRVRR